MTDKKLLVVCYGFPPNPGVGGRRWAKLSKFIHAAGVDISVMRAMPHEKATSPWNGDIVGIKTLAIPRFYPTVLTGNTARWHQKIAYRIFVILLKIITNSNYYDRAVLLEKRFKRSIVNAIKSDEIGNIAVTGAPFSLLYYMACIKLQNPHINFIADIRDSWLDDNYFGYGLIGKKRQKEEKRRLRMVLKFADHIIVPYPFMQKDYAEMGGGNRVLLQPHGFDDSLIMEPLDKRETTTFVNLGSQYFGLEDEMKSMAIVLNEMDCHLDIYTDDLKYLPIIEEYSKSKGKIKFQKVVPEKEVFRIISQSAAVLLFTNEAIKDLVATKYIETIAARTPIVVIGKEGRASRFVVENKLGLFISSDRITKEFSTIKTQLENLNYNRNFDLRPYSMKNQADEIIKMLI